jgi:hypothetical protein
VIVVLGLTRGKRGIGRLVGGLKRWRVGLGWYAASWCRMIKDSVELSSAIKFG